MCGKALFVFCAQALLIQSVFSQCTSRAAVDASGFPGAYGAYPTASGAYGRGACGSALAYDGLYAAAAPALDYIPTNGGGLPVSSLSSNAPVGISVVSQNAYEGVLAVTGELPFVGTTSFSGVVPSAGSGAINHACGNGINAMTAISDSSSPASVCALSSYGLTGSALNAPYANAAYGAPALAANGLAANGCAASGLAANGFTANGLAANGFTANGLAANGFTANGLAANGYAGNGLAVNGFGTNGLAAPLAGCSSGLAAPVLAYDAPYGAAYGYDGLYADGIEFTATSGGALPVSSASAIPPTGIAVASETVYEGPLEVIGELPFVATVSLEGVLPTAGSGVINHACGNGRNAMISDSEAFGAYGGAYGAYAPAAAIAPTAAISPAAALAPAAGCAAGYNYPARLGGYGYAI